MAGLKKAGYFTVGIISIPFLLVGAVIALFFTLITAIGEDVYEFLSKHITGD